MRPFHSASKEWKMLTDILLEEIVNILFQHICISHTHFKKCCCDLKLLFIPNLTLKMISVSAAYLG